MATPGLGSHIRTDLPTPTVSLNSRLSAAASALESMSICVMVRDASALARTSPRLPKVIVVGGRAGETAMGDTVMVTLDETSPAGLVSMTVLSLTCRIVQNAPLPKTKLTSVFRLTASARALCIPF